MTSKDLAPGEDGGGGVSSGGKTRKRKSKSRNGDGEPEPDRRAAGDAGGRSSRGRRRRDDGGALDPLYDTLTRLERADAQAAASSPFRGGRSGGDDVARSRAARSQYGMGNRLIEVRILMQRTLQQAATALHTLEDHDARGDSTGVRKKRRREGSGDDDLDDSDEGQGSDSGSDDDGDGVGQDGNVMDDCRRADALLRQVRTSLLSARDSALPALLASARLKNRDETVAAGGGDDDNPDAIEERMRNDHERCREAWRAILDRRHRDVQLRSGLATMGTSSSRDKFTVVNQGFWDQVESTLAHERLHRVDGEERGDDADDGENASSAPRPVYDDARSYQHMLRDFIERGSRGGSVGDGGTAAEQQLHALRKSNKKRKAEVDRRASKGRKIRYGDGLHPKLEGFTFPVPRGSTAGIGVSGGTIQSMMIDEDDWFKSLFGGAASRKAENGRRVAEPM